MTSKFKKELKKAIKEGINGPSNKWRKSFLKEMELQKFNASDIIWIVSETATVVINSFSEIMNGTK